jgi:hypothetical protein
MLLLRRAGVELDRDVICLAEAGKEEILPSLVQFLWYAVVEVAASP